jgi:hypothetical protein
MAKLFKILTSPKKMKKAIRKNPMTTGAAAAVLAAGGVAAAMMRNGSLRKLTEDVRRRWTKADDAETIEAAATH